MTDIILTLPTKKLIYLKVNEQIGDDCNALHPSKQFFSHAKMISCLPVLN